MLVRFRAPGLLQVGLVAVSLSLVAGVASVRAQEPTTIQPPSTRTLTPADYHKRALEALQIVLESYPEYRTQEAGFRAMIERVYEDRDNALIVEKQTVDGLVVLARQLLSRDGSARKDTLDTALRNLMGATPKVTSEERKIPVVNPAKASGDKKPVTKPPVKSKPTKGETAPVVPRNVADKSTTPLPPKSRKHVPRVQRAGVVTIRMGEKVTTVAEILTGTNEMSAKERARIVAERIETTIKADKIWYTKLSAGQVNNEWVVRCPSAPEGYIVTADATFARTSACTPESLAKSLMKRIRFTISSPLISRSEITASPQETANGLRERGDEAFNRDDLGSAENFYTQALNAMPDYIAARERLILVRLESNNSAGAKKLVDEADKMPTISAEDRKRLHDLLEDKDEETD